MGWLIFEYLPEAELIAQGIAHLSEEMSIIYPDAEGVGHFFLGLL